MQSQMLIFLHNEDKLGELISVNLSNEFRKKYLISVMVKCWMITIRHETEYVKLRRNEKRELQDSK